MCRVESEVVLVGEVHADAGAQVARESSSNPTVRIDGHGDARVRCA